MKILKVAYWIVTLLMCALFLFSASMYLTEYEMVEMFYDILGFPSWIIYPSAILKILGVVAVLVRKPKWLMEWAYAGFFFDAVLATAAHYFNNEGLISMAFIGILLVLSSRFLLSQLPQKNA